MTFVYDGPGLYRDKYGQEWFVDPLPEPQSERLRDWFILSQTTEEREREMPEAGRIWYPRHQLEKFMLGKVEVAV